MSVYLFLLAPNTSETAYRSFGIGWIISIEHYGSNWRLLRKSFHEEFKADVLARYDALQANAVHALLRTLVTEPDEFVENIKQ